MSHASMPKKSVPIFEKKNAVLHNAYKNPVTVAIDDKTSVELRYHGWPTVCRDEKGTLYVVSSIRVGHVDPHGATALLVSHDGGNTWEGPRIINDTSADDRDAGIVYLGNGRLIVSYFTIGADDFLPGGTYHAQLLSFSNEAQRVAKEKQWADLPADSLDRISWNGFLLFSDDYGATWSKPHLVPATDPHGPTVARDGSLWQGRASQEIGGCRLYRSVDGGMTWEMRKELLIPFESESGYCSEPYLVQLKNGSYVLGIRAGDFKGDDSMLRTYISFSDDGYEFTKPYPIEGVVGVPPHFLELSNGALLLTYSYRAHLDGPNGIRGRVSYDGGHTWDEEIIISEAPEKAHPGEVGYPSTAELDDGTLITVYYQPENDEEHLFPSILYTRWRLEEA